MGVVGVMFRWITWGVVGTVVGVGVGFNEIMRVGVSIFGCVQHA